MQDLGQLAPSTEVLATLEGRTSAPRRYRAAQSLWAYRPLTCAPHSWVASIGSGPYVLARISSESIDF